MASSSSVDADVQCGGYTLNVAQQLAVSNALTKLKINEKLPNITFWGKIFGTTNDYLVAICTLTGSAIEKRFYFSSDGGSSFARLPATDEWVRGKIATIFKSTPSTLFTGQPGLEIKDPSQPQKQADDKTPPQTPPESPKPAASASSAAAAGGAAAAAATAESKRRLTELDRLADTVERIERATAVVLKGQHVLTPTGQIQTNSDFKGLNAFESSALSSYALYRRTEHAATLARVRKIGLTNCYDFLDLLTDEPPKVWSLLVDSSGSWATLRHLEWPGFEFVHQISTPHSQRAYFGWGTKNTDLNFML